MKAQSLLKIFAVSATIAMLTGCNHSSGNNKAVARTNNPRGPQVSVNQNFSFSTTCSDGSSAVGQVFANGTNDFRTEVVGLASATMPDANDNLGDISGTPNDTTGVDLYLHIPSNGSAINQVDSGIRLVIYDSFVGTSDDSGNTVQPYSITVPAKTGQFNSSTGAFQIIFQDAVSANSQPYGTITVSGQVQGGVAQGTISYDNFTNADSGAAAVHGQLNVFTFSMPACGLIAN